MTAEIQLRPPEELEGLNVSRRLAYAILTAARTLGISVSLPFDQLLDALLCAATANPAVVSPDVYRAVNALRAPGDASSGEAAS